MWQRTAGSFYYCYKEFHLIYCRCPRSTSKKHRQIKMETISSFSSVWVSLIASYLIRLWLITIWISKDILLTNIFVKTLFTDWFCLDLTSATSVLTLVFLTHVGIQHMSTWLPRWKAKSLSHWHCFADVIFSASSKVQHYQIKTGEKSLNPNK